MPSPGQVISHYRVQDKLGEGAVGVVYSAEDLSLGRQVALKFLSAEFSEDRRSVERLRREAQTASLLSHPHICTIYEIEQFESAYFIAMELLEGATLEEHLRSGAVELPEVLRWGIQVCKALESAAGRGVVHRDLKPANIFITKQGDVKLLDFGLAMMLPKDRKSKEEKPKDQKDSRSIRLTFPGLVVGTVAYMSPEQACGEQLDSRSDLFSLGIVLYELATGVLPFYGAGWNDTMQKILHSEPAPPESINPDLPASFGRVIAKCLQKSPQDRYQTAAELARELSEVLREVGESVSGVTWIYRRLTSRRVIRRAAAITLVIAAVAGAWWAVRKYRRPPPSSAVTIAVMPFRYVSDDPAFEFMGMALPDEITNVLSHDSAVSVRPFESSRRFASGDDPAAAGRQLGVHSVLSGRYWVVGNEITLTLELVDVDMNRVIWEDTVSGNVADQPVLNALLEARTRHDLLPALGVNAGAAQNESKIRDPRAYELYLHAIGVSRDPAPNRNAIALLERAVAIDAEYAPAWDELGQRYYYDAQYGDGGTAAFSKAFAAYQHAAQLDPELADAVINVPELLVEKGELYGAYDNAIEIVRSHPGNSDAQFGLSYILRYGGDLNSAADYCNAAEKAAPGYYAYRSCSYVFMEMGNYERAQHFASLDAGSQWFHNNMALVLVRQHKDAEALAQKRLAGASDLLSACLAHRPAAEIEALATQTASPALPDPGDEYQTASVEAYCGQNQHALDLLSSAVKGNYCSYPSMDSDPLFDSVRDTPQFAAIRASAMTCQKNFLKHRAQPAGGQTPAN